jgi:hypothetical protein
VGILIGFSIVFSYLLKTKLTMEPVQTTQTPAPPATSSRGLLGTKIPATTAFVLAVLLFLLPFAEVKCNGSPIANNTGLGIAIGSEWKEVVSKNIFGNEFNQNSGNTGQSNDHKKQDPNKFAIAALALGIIGLLIAFLVPKGGGVVNVLIGVLVAVSLIVMLIDLKSKTKPGDAVRSSEFGINTDAIISVDGTAAFYFAIILFLLAALFSWQRSKVKTA